MIVNSNADVRDFTRPGDGLTGADIADGSVDGGKSGDVTAATRSGLDCRFGATAQN